MVSRRFLVQQAVLNALKTRLPWTVEQHGVGAAALIFDDWIGLGRLKTPVEWVRVEYRRLAAQYGEASTP